jgi:hypothetical protein
VERDSQMVQEFSTHYTVAAALEEGAHFGELGIFAQDCGGARRCTT